MSSADLGPGSRHGSVVREWRELRKGVGVRAELCDQHVARGVIDDGAQNDFLWRCGLAQCAGTPQDPADAWLCGVQDVSDFSLTLACERQPLCVAHLVKEVQALPGLTETCSVGDLFHGGR